MTGPRHPGPVALLGSGETSPVGGRVFESIAFPRVRGGPLRVSVLETPAGFEPNSDRVAGGVADFLRLRLAGRRPEVEVVPARRRGAPSGTDDPGLLRGALRADLLFLGPGSPTYAVRHLRDTLAWNVLLARHRLGAAVVLASAAMIAASRHALPVYEIFKAGADLHWVGGLDLFGPFGLSLALVPHWNNADGGEKVDTRRCYMGTRRFDALRALLPGGCTIVGVDENTALVVRPHDGTGEVVGQGTVTVIRAEEEASFGSGSLFELSRLGPFRPVEGGASIRPDAWDAASEALEESAGPGNTPLPPEEVRSLAEARAAARARRDWPESDALRERIRALGWRVSDGADGQALEPDQPE